MRQAAEVPAEMFAECHDAALAVLFAMQFQMAADNMETFCKRLICPIGLIRPIGHINRLQNVSMLSAAIWNCIANNTASAAS